MPNTAIRVLCVEDHRIVREGLALIINQEPDMKVVGSCATVDEAIELYRTVRPDVTLMDLRLGSASGVDAIKAIRKENPDARIIVLTMYEGDEDIFRAHQAGASTYLLKDTLSSDLVRVVREVHAGQRPVLPEVQARLAERASMPTLTSREVEVLQLISQGLRNKEVGAMLGITEGTVQIHVKNIFAKLSVNDRTGAVQVAVRRGLIHMR
ncbi:MAG TPA: response regulator transcription factor [Vicinamibacterales bacterium]|nr:response regulator transcription factor [Vicinamibacterales bacterium]